MLFRRIGRDRFDTLNDFLSEQLFNVFGESCVIFSPKVILICEDVIRFSRRITQVHILEIIVEIIILNISIVQSWQEILAYRSSEGSFVICERRTYSHAILLI